MNNKFIYFKNIFMENKQQIRKDFEEIRVEIENNERKMWLFLRIFYLLFPIFIGVSYIFKLFDFSISDLGSTFMVIFLVAGVIVPFYIIYLAEKYNREVMKDRKILKNIYSKVGLKISSQRWRHFGISFLILTFFITILITNIWTFLLVLLSILFIEIQGWQDKKLHKRFYEIINQ